MPLKARGYLYDDDIVLDHLLTLPLPEFREIIQYLAKIDLRNADLLGDILARLSVSEHWQHEVKETLARRSATIPFLTAHPRVLVSQLRSPILKKDRNGQYKMQREEIRRLGLLGLINNEVREEIDSWDGS